MKALGIAVVGLLLGLVIGLAVSGHRPVSTKPAAAAVPDDVEPPPPPAPAPPPRVVAIPQVQPRVSPPPDQARFVAILEKASAAYGAGQNELAQGAARPARARDLCAAMVNTSVTGWIGTLKQLSTNNDGRGVIAVEIGNDVILKTWNNAFSDVSDRTLIAPESALYAKALGLKLGQRVRFSGTLFRSQTDCFHEASLTMDGSMRSPEFIFRFFDLAAF